MLDKFKIGDRVKFITPKADPYCIGSIYFFEDNSSIPGELLSHGSTYFSKNEGTIVAVHKPYYFIVEYRDTAGTKVRLGFEGKSLQLYPKKGSLQAAVEKIRKEINDGKV